jgi:hypothetical protein
MLLYQGGVLSHMGVFILVGSVGAGLVETGGLSRLMQPK